MKVIVGLILAAGLLAGCSGTAPTPIIVSVTPAPSQIAVEMATPAPTPTPTVVYVTPAPTPKPTPVPTPKPTPKPAPIAYQQLGGRGWALVVKAPDNYTGRHYVLRACITQFDAATGPEAFLSRASYQNLDYWYSDGEPVFFNGPEGRLKDYAEGDIVQVNATSPGSHSYDTQAGGNTTVPLVYVDKIARIGSGC